MCKRAHLSEERELLGAAWRPPTCSTASDALYGRLRLRVPCIWAVRSRDRQSPLSRRDRSGRMCVVGPILVAQGLWSARGRSRSSGDGSIHAPPVALDAGARSDDLLSPAALDRRVRERRPRIPDLQLRVHVTRRRRRSRTDENLQDGGARPTVLTPAFQPHPTMHLGKALRLGRARTLDPCDNLGVR